MLMQKYIKYIFIFFKTYDFCLVYLAPFPVDANLSKKTFFFIIRLLNFPIGCPFVCSVSDTSRVSVSLSSLELVPVNQVARFHMAVDSSGSAELAVAVTGPSCELPVKVCRPTQLIVYIVFLKRSIIVKQTK